MCLSCSTAWMNTTRDDAWNWTSAGTTNATTVNIDRIGGALRTTQTIFLSFLLLSSLFLNCFDLIMLLRSRRRKTPIYLMQTNLVLADSLVTLIIMPSNLYYLVVNDDVMPVYCEFSGCLRYTCLICSLFSEASIAIMRQLAVTCPYGFRNNFRRSRVLKILVCLWSFALACGLLPIFVNETRYSTYIFQAVCDINTPITNGGIAMVTVLVVIGVLLPVVTMATCYLWLLFSLTQHSTVIIVGSNNNHIPDTTDKRQMRPRKVVLHMKARSVIFAILVKVVCLLLPFCALTLMTLLAGGGGGRAVAVYGSLSVWLLYVNIAVNPVIYGFLNKQLRQDFYEYLDEQHPGALGAFKSACQCCCRFPPEKEAECQQPGSAIGMPYGAANTANKQQQIRTISEKIVGKAVLCESIWKDLPAPALARQRSSTMSEMKSSRDMGNRSRRYFTRQSTLSAASSSSRSSTFSMRKLSRQKRLRSSESYSPTENRHSNMPDLINYSDSFSHSTSSRERRESLKSHFSAASLGNRARRLSQSTRSRLKNSFSRSKSDDRHELPLLDLMSLGESDDHQQHSSPESDCYRVSLQELPEESYSFENSVYGELADAPAAEVNYRSEADSVSLPPSLQRSRSLWSDRHDGKTSDRSGRGKRALSLGMLQQLYDSFIDIKGVSFDSTSEISEADSAKPPPVELQRTMSCGSVVVSNVFNGTPRALRESPSSQLPGCVARESICSTIPE